MKQLSEREQQYAYVAAGLGAGTCVVFLALSLGESAAFVVAGLGIVTAGLVAMAARSGNRLSAGVGAALLAFGPSPAWMVGLPYLMLFGWFTLRAARLRAQQEPEPEVDENGDIVVKAGERPAREPRPPRTRRTSRRRRAAVDAAASAASADAAGRRRPPPSKRYTPPQRPR